MRRWTLPLLLAIAGVALIGALRFYNESSQREFESQLWIPKTVPLTPEIALLRQYVRIDTTNPPGNELPGARFLAGILEKKGIHAEVIESFPGQANVYARLRGTRPGGGLLLVNHIDVAPADAKEWRRPPFAAEIFMNQLYGRGTLDMKGIGICELLAFIDLAQSGRPPAHDVVFLATADEENGGAKGMAWLLDHRPDIFEGMRYAINEGGITETTQERITYFGIEVGTKMTVTVTLRGPDRPSMQALRIALEPFMTPDDPDRVLPQVRTFLHELAPWRVEQGKFLDDINRTIVRGKFWLLPTGYRELTQNVVLPLAVESDAKGTVMHVSLFNLPDENPDTRIEWLRGMATRYGVKIEEVMEKSGPTPISPIHGQMYDLIAAEAQAQYPGAHAGSEILVAFYNDSRYLRTRSIDAYGVMPFPTDWYQTQGIHGIDERVRVDWFNDGVALLKRITRRFALAAN
jgi:acetylornithine deacetylase/succinyl-diaminopimelate desuccinylase-like protein